jgi:hypothetical protein
MNLLVCCEREGPNFLAVKMFVARADHPRQTEWLFERALLFLGRRLLAKQLSRFVDINHKDVSVQAMFVC